MIYFLWHDNGGILCVLSQWEHETLCLAISVCVYRLLPGEPFEDMKFVAWQVVQKYVSIFAHCSRCNSLCGIVPKHNDVKAHCRVESIKGLKT